MAFQKKKKWQKLYKVENFVEIRPSIQYLKRVLRHHPVPVTLWMTLECFDLMDIYNLDSIEKILPEEFNYRRKRKPTDVYHCVILVGYGTSDGVDYWVIRNSFGVGWGCGGYARIRLDSVDIDEAYCIVPSSSFYQEKKRSSQQKRKIGMLRNQHNVSVKKRARSSSIRRRSSHRLGHNQTEG